ncbi:MAG: MetQ/NlpA family ABC transporter substrate-binding protein [Clostridia bacterium]|nr:MetQ/NlpA family ABC transporter substrate-binding protein [Clostridia bacterium]
MKKSLVVKVITLALIVCALTSLALAATACSNKDDPYTIVIGASPTPHAEILKDVVADILKEQGYTLKVREYNDYVLPNTAVESGELDANYFQHKLYLSDFNAQRGTHLVAVADVHYEPFGAYVGGKATGLTSLADLPEGAIVSIPNDGTNEARALYLLAQSGLITLKDGVTTTATKLDIVSNPKNLVFRELEAAQLPKSLPDVHVAVINGNYALAGGLTIANAIAAERSDAEGVDNYINVIAVKEGNQDKPKIKALAEALKSDAVREYIINKYSGAVKPVQ